MHRRADLLDADRDHRVEVVVKRIAERRDKHHRAGGAGLVNVVHELRIPLDEQNAILVRRLFHVHRDRIAIVVVADVFVVKPREAAERALLLVGDVHIPVGDELDAIGIRHGHEEDVVVEEAHRLLVGLRDHLINLFDEALRIHRLGRVEAAVDPDDRAGDFRHGVRLVLGHFGAREFLRHRLVVGELRHVRRRSDDRHVLLAAFFGEADAHDLQAVRLGRPLLLHRGDLRVAGHVVIVADVEPDDVFGRRDFWRIGGGRPRRRHQGEEKANHMGEPAFREGQFIHGVKSAGERANLRTTAKPDAPI